MKDPNCRSICDSSDLAQAAPFAVNEVIPSAAEQRQRIHADHDYQLWLCDLHEVPDARNAKLADCISDRLFHRSSVGLYIRRANKDCVGRSGLPEEADAKHWAQISRQGPRLRHVFAIPWPSEFRTRCSFPLAINEIAAGLISQEQERRIGYGRGIQDFEAQSCLWCERQRCVEGLHLLIQFAGEFRGVCIHR